MHVILPVHYMSLSRSPVPARIMAFLHCSARPHQPILGFRRPSCRPSTTVLTLGANVSSIHLNFRFKTVVSSQVRQSWFAVFASNANSDRDTPSEKSDDIKASDAGQGPPLATILAGLLVFLLICWIIGSILMWLVSLIFHSPLPNKL